MFRFARIVDSIENKKVKIDVMIHDRGKCKT
jgi:hypothetical protein